MWRWLLLLSLLLSGTPVLAQEPVLEGTTTCDAVSQWFADGYARQARKNSPAIEPYLVLFNGSTTAQTVTITVLTPTPTTVLRTLPARTRVVVDLFTEVGRTDADFSVDVAFTGYGAADLKMWSGGRVVTTATPLTVCRNGS